MIAVEYVMVEGANLVFTLRGGSKVEFPLQELRRLLDTAPDSLEPEDPPWSKRAPYVAEVAPAPAPYVTSPGGWESGPHGPVGATGMTGPVGPIGSSPQQVAAAIVKPKRVHDWQDTPPQSVYQLALEMLRAGGSLRTVGRYIVVEKGTTTLRTGWHDEKQYKLALAELTVAAAEVTAEKPGELC